MIKIQRAYDHEEIVGYRVLVDRLWPRGIKKDNLKLDTWEKELAPSTELRKWFDHDPAKWTEFKQKYQAELKDKTAILEKLKQHKNLVLIYGAKDEMHNNAVVLQDILNRP